MSRDAAARLRALDPEQSFIVQAPAGSGKTGLLVYRFLTLLARVSSPQSVLAITFTRKATSEMRERVMGLLERAQANESSDNEFEQQGLSLARAVLLNDERHGWALLKTPHQLSIMTIDAFCARLSASMPWLSRLGDRPRPSDDASAHYSAAVENVLRELLNPSSTIAEELNSVLAELDYNYNSARNLFAQMLAKRDQWLRYFLETDLSNSKEQLERAWQELYLEPIATICARLSDAGLKELNALARFGAHQTLSSSDTSQAKDLFNTALDESSSTQHWQAITNLCLTKSGTWRKRVDKNMGFAAGLDETKRLKELLSSLAENDSLLDAFKKISELPIPKYTDNDWRHLLALETVLKRLAAELQLRFRATSECDHSEVTQRANFALSELGGASDASLMMEAEIQHVLVDEFQDTSYSQIELLQKLTQSWQGEQTLFLVGDPMQSIYRFREAQVSLFLQVARNRDTKILPQVDISYIALEQNFRSSEPLVKWFNTTFSHAFAKQDNVLRGAICYAPASANKPGLDDPVEAHLSEDKPSEAGLVCDLVKQTLPELPEGAKLAILVRSRSQLSEIVPALRAQKIDFTGVNLQVLSELPAVLDLANLCLAICRTDDRIAWLALLRGPWLGLNLEELLALSETRAPTLWQALNDSGYTLIRKNLHARLSSFIGVMEQALAEFQVSDLASLCRWAWQRLGGPACLLGASMADIDTALDLIAELEQGADLPSSLMLEAALQTRFANTAEQAQSARVIVSTMHKAKGLQYHTVILPCLANTPRADDKNVLMWAEAQAENGDPQLFLAPLLLGQQSLIKQNALHGRHSHFDFLRGLERERAEHESARLLYVAATRAEQRLILTANLARDAKNDEHPKNPDRRTLLARIWDASQADFQYRGSHAAKPPSLNDESNVLNTLLRLDDHYLPQSDAAIDWKGEQIATQSESPENQVLEFEWATEMATAVGVVLHQFLQHHGDEVLNLKIGPEILSRWRDELKALRVPFERLGEAQGRLQKAIRNIQNDDKAHFLFAPYQDAQNELAIAAHENGQVKYYRLDRTFTDNEGRRWIVDYKSTVTRQADVEAFAREQVELRHRSQLEHYGQLFTQLNHHQGVTQPIRLAVYFPLLQQLVSWPLTKD